MTSWDSILHEMYLECFPTTHFLPQTWINNPNEDDHEVTNCLDVTLRPYPLIPYTVATRPAAPPSPHTFLEPCWLPAMPSTGEPIDLLPQTRVVEEELWGPQGELWPVWSHQ